jgi:hypothetical protein
MRGISEEAGEKRNKENQAREIQKELHEQNKWVWFSSFTWFPLPLT